MRKLLMFGLVVALLSGVILGWSVGNSKGAPPPFHHPTKRQTTIKAKTKIICFGFLSCGKKHQLP